MSKLEKQKKGQQKSKFQKFELLTMSRNEIKESLGNPRIITDNAQKKLKDKMKTIGLLQPIVVNRQTGNLISGHQRLKILDGLEKNKEYMLDVSIINIDEKAEKEMMVFFNNTSAQGEWDLDKLAALNLVDNIDFDDMGFDKFDVDMLFDGDSRFSQSFEDSVEVKKTEAEIEKIRDARSKGVEDMKEKNNAEFYFVVVCQDDEERKELLRKIGMPVFEQFVPGYYLGESLKNKNDTEIQPSTNI